MRSRAKQCAGAVLVIAVPFLPVVSTPTGTLAHPSSQPFFSPVRSEARVARALEAISWAPAPRPSSPAPLEAVEIRAVPSTFLAPAPVPHVSLSTPAAPITITVAEGQTVWQIARAHGVAVEAIVGANGLRAAEFIRVGQRLIIPQAAASSQTTHGADTNLAHPADAGVAPPTKRVTSLQHEVGEGETLWAIAQHYHVSVPALTNANGLNEQALIHPGLKLAIPASEASGSVSRASGGQVRRSSATTTIVVKPGDNLGQIADTYGVSVFAIVEANSLQSSEFIRAGQRLLIPGTGALAPRRQAFPAPAAPPVRRVATAFLWPARGVMTSGFGWRRSHHHNGIDISASRGSPITAAMAGTVIFAGWYYGYGLAVIVDHGDGLITLYGHASRVTVHPRDQVEAGQMIARVGCTGICSGPHLHFEVRIDGRPSNPLQYLP